MTKQKEQFQDRHEALLSKMIEEARDSIGADDPGGDPAESLAMAFQFFNALSSALGYLEEIFLRARLGPAGTENFGFSPGWVDHYRDAGLIAGTVYARQELRERALPLIEGEIDMGRHFDALLSMFLDRAFSDAGMPQGFDFKKLSQGNLQVFILYYRVFSELAGYCKGILETLGIAREMLQAVWNLRRGEGSMLFHDRVVKEIPPTGEMH